MRDERNENESILADNFSGAGGTQGFNIEYHASGIDPDDVIDSEFEEVRPAFSQKRKLFLALAGAGLVTAGLVGAYFSGIVGGGSHPPEDVVAMQFSGDARTPFSAPLEPSNAQLPTIQPAADEQSYFSESATIGVDDSMASIEPSDAGESVALSEDEAEAAASEDGEGVTAEAAATPPETEGESVAQASAPDTAGSRTSDPEPVAASEPETTQETATPKAHEAPTQKAEAPAPTKAAATPAPAPRAQPARTQAPTQRAASTPAAQPRTQPRAQREQPSSNTEIVREIIRVTPDQIGLRSFTKDVLVVAQSGQVAHYKVNDLLPSGERIEGLDPATMTVMTDRTIIRVVN